MIKREFSLNMTLVDVLKLVHVWLLSNGFKIEKEVVKSSRSATIAKNPAHHSLEIYISSNARKSNVLLRGKDEVLSLITFLQSGGISLQPQLQQQQQQQQIVVNIVPPSPPIVQPPSTNLECPFCHAQLQSAYAIFCERCGQRLIPVQTAPPPTSDSVMFCNKCGARLRLGAAFCRECGVAITNNTPIESMREAQPPLAHDLIFCSRCGAENAGTAEACSACGAPLHR